MTVKSRVVAATVVMLIAGIVAFGLHRHRQQRQMAEHYRENLRLAQGGDAKAEDRLGNDYFYGKGFPQSFSDAMSWYRKAAAQGDAHSEFALGYMYATGTGVAQNYPEAMNWYSASAARGYARAADAVGSMYFYGQGMATDSDAAFAWYRRAADGGEVQAEEYIGTMYFFGQGVPRNYDEAARLYRRAAEQGYAPAEYDLGYMYYHGYGVPRSLWQSRKWYRKAAAQGNAKALRVVSEGLSLFAKGTLLVKLICGLLLLIPLRIRTGGTSERLGRLGNISSASGILSLLLAGLGWYGYSHQKIWHLLFVPNVFTAIYSTLDIAMIVLLIKLLRLAVRNDADDLP